MSKRSQQKRQARAKEKAKLARRARGISPLDRLAGDGSNIDCWMHRGESDDRMVSLFAFRPIRGGGSVAAFFLIDYDCIGLKDAFYGLDVSPSETLQKYRSRTQSDGSRVIKITPERLRGAVAAAIRWTNDQHFRMPEDLPKCLKIIDGPVDSAAADTAVFGKEGGGLRYVGRESDLEDLLIDETLEEFMAREDVECIFMGDEMIVDDFDGDDDELEDDELADDEWDDDEEDDDEMDDVVDDFQQMSDALAAEVHDWLLARGLVPHEQLTAAVHVRAMAMMAALAEGKMELTGDQAMVEFLETAEPGPERDALRDANQQISDYVAATKSLPQLQDPPQ